MRLESYDLRDEQAVARALQDQNRAAALDHVRTADMFAVSTTDESDGGGLLVSLNGDGAECAGFVLTTIVHLWELLSDVTGESDAAMVMRLMCGLAMTRANETPDGDE